MPDEKKTGNYLILSNKSATIELFDFKTKRSFRKRGLLPRRFALNKA